MQVSLLQANLDYSSRVDLKRWILIEIRKNSHVTQNCKLLLNKNRLGRFWRIKPICAQICCRCNNYDKLRNVVICLSSTKSNESIYILNRILLRNNYSINLVIRTIWNKNMLSNFQVIKVWVENKCTVFSCSLKRRKCEILNIEMCILDACIYLVIYWKLLYNEKSYNVLTTSWKESEKAYLVNSKITLVKLPALKAMRDIIGVTNWTVARLIRLCRGKSGYDNEAFYLSLIKSVC